MTLTSPFQVIDVRNFGAVGDGKTDDTAAIQRAIDWNSISLTCTGTTSTGTGGKVLTFGANLTAEFAARLVAGIGTCNVTNITNPASLSHWTNPPQALLESVNVGSHVTLTFASVVHSTIQIGDVIRFDFASRANIFFPIGRYLITKPLTLDYDGELSIILQGSGNASWIVGTVPGYILQRNVSNPTSGIRVVRNLKLSNSHPDGGCIRLNGSIGASVENCHISGARGISFGYSNNSCQVVNCILMGHRVQGGFGICGGNGCVITNCDITAFEEGVRHSNIGLQVIGGRMERNARAIVLGHTEANERTASTNVILMGISMESNDVAGIDISSGSHISIIQCGMGAHPEYRCQFGLRLQGGQYIEIVNPAFGGYYEQFCIDLTNANGAVNVINPEVNNSCSTGGLIKWPDEAWKATLNYGPPPI